MWGTGTRSEDYFDSSTKCGQANEVGLMDPVASPCTERCSLDRHRRWCVGCGRTASEIGRWSTASEIEKQKILSKLDSRLRLLQKRG